MVAEEGENIMPIAVACTDLLLSYFGLFPFGSHLAHLLVSLTKERHHEPLEAVQCEYSTERETKFLTEFLSL